MDPLAEHVPLPADQNNDQDNVAEPIEIENKIVRYLGVQNMRALIHVQKIKVWSLEFRV